MVIRRRLWDAWVDSFPLDLDLQQTAPVLGFTARSSNQLVFDIVNRQVRRLRDRLYAPDLTFGINHNFCAL